MKKVFLLLLAVVLSVSADAKSLRELWVSMPDSLLPTLNQNLRLELIDLVDMKVKPEVRNLLGEDCQLDTLTSDFLEFSASSHSKVQMRLLPQVSGDSTLCVIQKFSAPASESVVRFFDGQWNELSDKNYLPSDITQLSKYLKAKPDTLSESDYRGLVSLIEPFMVSAEFAGLTDSLVFSVSLPLVSNEEKTKINAILLQRKFKWEGNKFNEN